MRKTKILITMGPALMEEARLREALQVADAVRLNASHGDLDSRLTALEDIRRIALELDRRIGSLEVGKDADMVVLSGDPLALRTKVLQTFVEGRKVFDRDDPDDRLYAVGGYGASHDQQAEMCCGGPAQ